MLCVVCLSRREQTKGGVPMKIEISALLGKREPYKDFSFDLVPEEIEDSAGLPEDITLTSPVKVEGRIKDCDGYFTVKATISAGYETVCDRCLAPIKDKTEFTLEKIAVTSASELEKIGADEDEVVYVEDGGIDMDRDIIEELSLELPLYHLCSEDCPGLCDVCGKRLEGECRCKKEKEIDPRMESFQKLLEKMKKE